MLTCDCASFACMSAVPFAFSISTRAVCARSSSAKVAFSWLAISRWVSTVTSSGGNTTSWMYTPLVSTS